MTVSDLPMFPLGTVLFPHALLPLHVFEPRVSSRRPPGRRPAPAGGSGYRRALRLLEAMLEEEVAVLAHRVAEPG